jgi:hypothetical protein
MPATTYPVGQTTIDIRDLQRIPTTGPVDTGDSDTGEVAACTTVSCRYDWTCGG